jgi:hypothetical protein
MARKKETEDGAVVSAAKAKADDAGKMASPAAATPPPAKTAKVKIGKLPAKNKSRLPRRQKKAQQKLAMAKDK